MACCGRAAKLEGAPPQRSGSQEVNATAPAIAAASPRAWVDAAAVNEQHVLNDEDRLPLRYRVHKVDNKGDVVREVIESREGNIARLIGRNAAPLSPEENGAERERLEGILASPGDFLRREQRDRASRRYALELIQSMPEAMLWSYTPGQPQMPNVHAAQVVLDFLPNPAFKPPSLVTEGLAGVAGRIWIDSESRCPLRIEGRILHPINYGWGGMLARVSEGGTIAFEQGKVEQGKVEQGKVEQGKAADGTAEGDSPGSRRWLYTRVSEHLTLREVMVHTVRQNTEMNIFDVQRLPTLPTYQDAVRTLLAMPVATR